MENVPLKNVECKAQGVIFLHKKVLNIPNRIPQIGQFKSPFKPHFHEVCQAIII